MTGVVAIVVFVVGLLVSIMIHEWGHFATARRFGMRADRFFLGFGPTIWSTQVGETEYGVKALPLGGFVRIAGMSPGDERLPSVPGALRARIAAGEEPVVAFRTLLEERGAPTEVRTVLVERFDRILGAGAASTTGAPLGVDLAPTDHEHDTHDHDGGAHAAATTAVRDAEPGLLAVELINAEVVPTGRVGDLHHRLTRGDEGRFFEDHPAWQRAIVLASGSGLHFLQAIVLIFLGWLLVGPTVVIPVVSAFQDAELPDGTVVPSVAEEAGLEIGDRIRSVDGVVSDDYQVLRSTIRDNPGETITLSIERAMPLEDGDAELAPDADPVTEMSQVRLTPAAVEDPETGETIGLVGLLPSSEEQPMDADEALYRTFVGDGSFPSMFTQTFGALGDVFGPEGISGMISQLSGEEERDASGGISLVGAANAAGQGTDAFGPLFLFVLLAAINVFIGIFNALPLPPLDGGHLAVLGVEEAVNARRRARGEPDDYSVDPNTVASIALPVIVFVVLVSVALLVLDITNPLQLN